jgi:hypothetical protein
MRLESNDHSLPRSVFQTVCGFLLLCSIGAGVHSSAFAQSDSGRVAGTVTDSTGAVIPGATLTITNLETNAARIDKANAAGQFNIPALPPGSYFAKIEASGSSSSFPEESRRLWR